MKRQILKNRFCLIKSKEMQLSLTEAEDFYKEHYGRFFFTRLTHFMSSSPISVHILGRKDAISLWRQMLGPTKVTRSQYEAPDSIRGSFGLSDTRNVAHGSDSQENAIREIEFFFPEFDPLVWCQEELLQFAAGNLVYDDLANVHRAKLKSHEEFM